MPRIIEEPPPRRPAYFWWLLANLLALCFAVISWMLCLHVFGNPEVPRNYEILRKLGRLPELKRYTVLDVPNGSLLDPKGQYAKFAGLGDEPLQRLNSRLMRNYLTNFDKPLALTYIEGEYRIEQTRPLGPDDFIGQGFVVRARALVRPDKFTQPVPFPVLIDYVFPTSDPAAARSLRPGDVLEVRKSPNCAAILHIDRVAEQDDTLVCLTVVPIAYGPYSVGGEATFAIEPPVEVRPGASFPLFPPK